MLKSKINQALSTYVNSVNPGYLSRSGQVSSGGFITTAATIDNRELRNTDGIIVLSGFGRIDNIDEHAALPDDLVMLFGVDEDMQEEFVLFDKIFTTSGSVDFKIHLQLYLFGGQAYEGIYTASFSTGEVITKAVYIPNCGDNNFTTIRFKNTKISNSDIQINLQAFDQILLK
jgi:hypothetical protein